MAVTMRFARFGQKKRPFYRIVVANKGGRRDGKFIEIIGTCNRMVDPAEEKINEERVQYWVGVGADASRAVRDVFKRTLPDGDPIEAREKNQRAKIQERRKKRKARQAA